MRLLQKALLVVCIPLVMQCVVLGSLALLLKQADREAQREAHARAIVSACDTSLKFLYKNVEAAISFFGSRSDFQKRRYEKFRADLFNSINQLCLLLDDNPANFSEVANLKEKAQQFSKALDEANQAAENGGEYPLFKGYQINNEARRLVNEMGRELEGITSRTKVELGDPSRSSSSARVLISLAIIFGFAINIVLAVLLIIFFIKTTTSRLHTLMLNVQRLPADQPLLPPVSGSDEISELDGVFRRLAHSLKEVSLRERAIVDNAVDVICSLDEKGRFLAVNPASLKSWGYRAEELLRSSVFDIVMGEDVEKTKQYFRDIIEGTLHVFENRIARKDGQKIDFLWSAEWSASDRILFCIAHDISERKRNEELLKESENRIRSLIENMPVAVLSVDQDGLIELANPVSEALFEYEQLAPGTVSLDSLFTLPSNVERGRDLPSILKSLDGKNRFECTAKTFSGATFPAAIAATEYDSTAGRHLLLSVLNISEEMKIEQLRRDFVAMVSHDLSSPLTSVHGFLEILADGTYGELSENAQSRVKLAQRNVQRLLTLIRNLLDMEKLDSGAVHLELAEQNFAQLVRDSLGALLVLIESKQIKIEFESEDVFIRVDCERMIQVIVNLLSNAIKFSPEGAVISLTLKQDEEMVYFDVQDNGPGIAPYQQKRIFEKFRQASDSQANRMAGTGLGLAISRSIVAQHGGAIGLQSALGSGSRFWIRIPKSYSAPDAALTP